MLNWIKRIFFSAELDRLERYDLALNLAEQYMTQFDAVKETLAYIKQAADNEISLALISDIQIKVLENQKDATFKPTQPFTATVVGENERMIWNIAGNGEIQAANSNQRLAILCTTYSQGKIVRDVRLSEYVTQALAAHHHIEALMYFLMRYIRRERYAKGNVVTASHLADDVIRYLKDNNLLTPWNSTTLGAIVNYEIQERNKFFQSYSFKVTQGNTQFKHIY